MTNDRESAARAPNPLATQEQLASEDLAMRLMQSDVVQQAIARGRQIMQADLRARTASGRTTVELDLQELSFSACAMAAIADPTDPKVYWNINLPHQWFGRTVPGSRCGIDNPDNVYRLMAIDEQSSYVLTGQVPAAPPADVTFTIFPVWPGVVDVEAKGIFPAALGGISLRDLELDAAGGFTLALDPTPSNGRRNHVQIRPGACVLFIRDSMSDWARETPLYLTVQRIAGPSPSAPQRDETALRVLAAGNVERAARFWLDLPSKYYYQGEANQLAVTTNPAIAKGGQFTGNGHFELSDDEAYVLTLDPLGAAYVGVQLADLYGASLDYADHTASLNSAQMAANADGSLTYVLSLQDPGVYNWLDPTGLDTGLFMFRYQGYDPDKVRVESAIRTERVVKRSELESVLPRETRRVSREERRRQLAERVVAYNRRLDETMFGASTPA